MLEPVYLDYAAGNLSDAARLLVDTQLTMRPALLAQVAVWESVGAQMMEAESAPLADGAFETLQRLLDETTPPAAASPGPAPGGLPEPLASAIGRPLESLKWTSPIPGMFEWEFPQFPEARLLRLKPGGGVFEHSHTGRELTLILKGAYRDSEGVWEAGDVELADNELWHSPQVIGDVECLCLAVVEGHYRLKGLNRFLAAFTGFRGRLA